MYFKCFSTFLAFSLFCFYAQASDYWDAKWISHTEATTDTYTVLHFRNNFQLSRVPESLNIKISADIRYMLYVNGSYVGQGPANNDLRHYAFDQQDIAGFLQPGENTIAVTVFSFRDLNPVRYESTGAKFILQAETLSEVLNTGGGNWKVLKNNAYTPTLRDKDFEIQGYYAMGGGEIVNSEEYPWNWRNVDFDDTEWTKAVDVLTGQSYGNNQGYGEASLNLEASTLPAMDHSEEEKSELRSVTGSITGNQAQKIKESWSENSPIVIPKNSEITLLLDQSYLTRGFTFFTFSGGRNARIEISYAETLFNDDNSQGHRDSIQGKVFKGLKDIYFLDGENDREFSPLLSRVWRYIEVKIKTQEESLSWDRYRATKFIYPFKENAVFDSGLPLHKNIWNVGWRTAKLCAGETYMDCPYYEQLQYVGDTRIQALISLYVSGDDRLMKNAIRQFGHSITDEGITQSRFPSNLLQYIPPYALFWINMIHDYHMHRKDDAFTASYLKDIASVLFWFEDKLNQDKLLGPMPWWSYVDVVDTWPRSNPPGSLEGESIVLTLQYVYAMQEAIALFDYHKKENLSKHFSNLKKEVQEAVVAKSFNTKKGLFADTPEQKSYSQHANILAVITDTAPLEKQSDIFKNIISDPRISKTNIYFTFYLHRAAQKSGNGDFFLSNLGTWEKMLEEGLTTFAESREDTRSDCHAWSASPNYEFLNTVCGIQPMSPHFESIKIAPNPGSLSSIAGKMPHPNGNIAVNFTFKNKRISGEVNIPKGTKATLVWKGKSMLLAEGINRIKL